MPCFLKNVYYVNYIDKAKFVFSKIKKIQFIKNKEAIKLQKVFIELVNLIIKKQTIYYSDLSRLLNEKYDLKIPIKGSSLGRKLGNILGSLSIISNVNADVSISVYVINKQSKKAGEGLRNLLKILNPILERSVEEYNEDIEKYKVDKLFEILRK